MTPSGISYHLLHILLPTYQQRLGASWHHYHATLFISTFSSKRASLEFSYLSKEHHPLSNLYDFSVIFHLHLASSSSASSLSSILKTYPN